MPRINVKIPTERVIKALETRLQEMEKEQAEYDGKQAKYEAEYKKWKEKVASLAVKGKPTSTDVQRFYGLVGKKVTVSAYFEIESSKVPPRPEEPTRMSEYEYRNSKKEIENALRILKMTEQEEVSASTYNAIAQYL